MLYKSAADLSTKSMEAEQIHELLIKYSCVFTNDRGFGLILPDGNLSLSL